MSKTKQRIINDPKFGKIFVSESEHSLFMTNAKPDPNWKWVKRGNSYLCLPTLNRRAKRHTK